MKVNLNHIVLVVLFVGIGILTSSCKNTMKEYWDNGNIKTSISYLNTEKTDYEYCEYYDNGNLKIKTKYCDGLLEGKYQQYFRSGQLKLIRHFKKGKIDGVEQAYNNSGEIQYQRVYENSRIVKEQDYRIKLKATLN